MEQKYYEQRRNQVGKIINVYVAVVVRYERRRDSLPEMLRLLYRLKELTPSHRKLRRDWTAACRERDSLDARLRALNSS